MHDENTYKTKQMTNNWKRNTTYIYIVRRNQRDNRGIRKGDIREAVTGGVLQMRNLFQIILC